MRRVSLIVCSLMLLAFAVLSFTAVITKNTTYDETLHIPAAWANLHGDYRANPEHPPLWKYWSALPHLLRPLNTHGGDADWDNILEQFGAEWNWGIDVLYRTPGNDADAIANRARFMMMLLAVGLGAMLMAWSWRLAGPIAAIIAGALYCFDPNFLAHGSLVTNDIATTLCFFAWMWAMWRVGRSATHGRIAVLALLCGTAMIVKFSGILLAPLTILMLAIRAWSGPWQVLHRTLGTLRDRIIAAFLMCIVAALVSYAMIWAAYGFRYSATPEGKPLAWKYLLDKTFVNESFSQHPEHQVSPDELQSWQPSGETRWGLWINDHHLLPEAYCYGVLFVRTSGLVRSAYLLGQVSQLGWWYYFPLAILFKTPCATLLACVIAALIGWKTFSRRKLDTDQRWLAMTLIIPTAIYLLFMMYSNLDLGIRHIFEIYPPIYLGVGWALSGLAHRGSKIWKTILPLLAIFLLAESLSAYPNFIPFFNYLAGGSRGGIALLGDSNLDWGQDLKLLGQWRKSHPNKKLYLLYFGTADPAYYGIDYTNLPGSYMLGPLMIPPSTPGIIAASATDMQGIYMDDAEHQAYGWMLRTKPIKILGGSIYLFEWPPRSR